MMFLKLPPLKRDCKDTYFSKNCKGRVQKY